MTEKLKESDFEDAAFLIGCNVAAVKAVAEVESRGDGFLADGRPKILFEGHWFYKYTKGQYADSHPNICYPKWTSKYYLGGEKEYQRFEEAIELDRNAALLSTSYGKFQVMGFNYAICGYSSVEEFFQAMNRSEGDHLHAFCAYVKHNGLSDELRDHRWADFASGYNGKEYWKNKYDQKMAAAYEKYAQNA